MEIYKILEDIMEKQSLKIADVARLCSLPDSTVRGIITRKQKSVALEVAFKLSEGLKVTLEQLNGRDQKVIQELNAEDPNQIAGDVSKSSDREQNLIKKYRSLNESGKTKIDDYMKFVLSDTSNVRFDPDYEGIRKLGEHIAKAMDAPKKAPTKSTLK